MSKAVSPIVGIDLGTTHSLVAWVRDGKAEVLPTREGKRLLPSVVSFLSGDEPKIGYAARADQVRDAAHTVFSAKRMLGRSFEDLKSSQTEFPFRIAPATPGASSGEVRIELGGDRSISPIEVSAMILRELKHGAEAALGIPVSRAVITVPAYFNDSQRQATRAAGRLAGWDVLRIINEPTAASLAYGLERKKEGLIAVFDLGGGTFDISILRLRDGIFEVLSTGGDTALGGNDLDQAIAQFTIREWRSAEDKLSPQELAAVLEASENLKKTLSEKEEAVLELPGDYRKKWTRSEFEAEVRPVLERTREPCEQALRDAGISAQELSDVVLVGGPTRLRVVQEVAREIFGREPNTSLHPDEVVAVGAAIQADILAGNNRELLLLDVVPLSLGIETYGGVMSPLIPRNTKIPAVAREVFTTFVDKQTAVDIHVLQGERERVEGNRSLARFKLKGIVPQPAGLPRVEVTFLIDADGILQVSAKDLKTGNLQSVEVRPTFGLSEEEVQKRVAAGVIHHQEDVHFRQLVEARNDAEPVLRATEKSLEDARRILEGTEFRKIEEGLEGLKIAMAGNDPARIREAAYRLESVTQPLAQALLKEVVARPDQPR